MKTALVVHHNIILVHHIVSAKVFDCLCHQFRLATCIFRIVQETAALNELIPLALSNRVKAAGARPE